MNKQIKKSPIALAILCLLIEEPMHPYQMQKLIKERGKDEFINVRHRASIYQTIDRLLREEAITIQGKKQNEGKPDLIVYEVTEAGRNAAFSWVRDMLSTPKQEFLDFPAAVSFIMLLTPEDAKKQFEKRAKALKDRLAHIETQMKLVTTRGIPRLFLLEIEYQQTVFKAELDWVNSIMNDLAAGELKWDIDWLHEISAQLASQENLPNEG
jgi:DNA-binding PadR family transcriptional regulator